MSLIVRVSVDRSGVIEESLRIRGSLSLLSLTWIVHSFVRLSRECIVSSCVARRVSWTFDVARFLGRFAGTQGRRWYRHIFRRIRVAPFVVRRFSFFRHPRSLVRRDIVSSLLRFRFVLLRIPFSVSRAVSVCRLSSVVSLCVSVFRKGASFSFGFQSSFVVLRPVRLRSLARSLIR